MKKLFLTTLFLTFVISSLHAQTFTAGDLNYSVNDDGVSVTVINSAGYMLGDLIIPDTVTDNGNTYAVTAIGDYAFSFSAYEMLILPNTLVSIGNEAFYCGVFNCTLRIPNSVENIGYNAFFNCRNLTGHLTIPNSVTNIGSCAFMNCGFTGLTLPESLSSISSSAFAECNQMSGTLILPSSITSIEEYAFTGCSFTSIVSYALTPPELGEDAFSDFGCSTLTVPSGCLQEYQNSDWAQYFDTFIPCWDGTVAESYAGGTGSASDPFQIATPEQLALLAQQTNSGLVGIYHYVLTNDICLSGSNMLQWIPIGKNNDTSLKHFIGVFDGNGHTISDMYVTERPDSYCVGLFGYTASATIKNLNVQNSTINYHAVVPNAVDCAGLIAGLAENSHFINCTVDGSIAYEGDTGYSLGGLVGRLPIYYSNASTISVTDCINYATIQANCPGVIIGGGENGGIIGHTFVSLGNITELNIENCYNYGDIIAGGRLGGIVGRFTISNNNKGNVRNCENYGTITATNGYSGGIAAEAEGVYLENCVNNFAGSIYGQCVGGILSTTNRYATVISKCVNHAAIFGDFSAGGIVGIGCRVSNCYNTGDISFISNGNGISNSSIGGIAGEIAKSVCRNVYNTGNVASSRGTTRAGIVIGSLGADAQCRNLYWLGDYDIPACGDSLVPENSCAFRQGATPTTWVLDEPQYGTTDLIEALNRGSNYECLWLEDEDVINHRLPIFIDYPQNYPLIGAEWYYEITNDNGSITYQYLECAADTTIGTTRPKVVVKSNTLYDKDLHTKITHEYVYSENGIVYWWDKQSQSYTTLYNFNAIVGEQWTIHVGTHNITMRVDEVNNIEYGGQTYRVLTVSDADDIFSGDIICGIGHTTSFFPENLLNNRDFDVDGIRCYWHFGEELLQFGEVDCDEIYNQYNDVAENEEMGLEVYPNPTNGVITINSTAVETCHGVSLPQAAEYTITNICGQIVMKGMISGDNQQIDVENLESGVYFIKIGNYSMKFVKM